MALTFPEPTTQLHRLAATIEARLRLAFPAEIFGFQLMPPIPSRAEWERLTTRRPCLGLAWAGLAPDEKSGRMLSGRAEWVVYLIVDNSAVDRRFLGDTRGIGLLGMVTAASYLLHGWTLPDVGTAFVTGIESLTKEDWGNDTTAIAGLSLSVPIIPDAGIAAAPDLNDLLRIGATWLVNGREIAEDTINVGTSP